MEISFGVIMHDFKENIKSKTKGLSFLLKVYSRGVHLNKEFLK
jgi:hypothetical protein